MTSNQDLRKCLAYIDSYWDKITYTPKDNRGSLYLIQVPNPYLSVSTKMQAHWQGPMFYWDTYFIMRGILHTKREKIIPGIVDNFRYLFEKFAIIPQANAWTFLSVSQPPFFPSMVWDGYNVQQRISAENALSWMKKNISIAKKDYMQVWQDDKIYHHLAGKSGLNKYGDRDVSYPINAERESGWDFTTRFYNRAHEFAPVDLNTLLFVNENIFAKTAHIIGDTHEEKHWKNKAKKRKELINQLMWNEEKGFFFDWDFVNNKQSDFYSLAGFFPLWGSLATVEQAKRVRDKLKLFDTKYGLTATAEESLAPPVSLSGIPDTFRPAVEAIFKPKQWDYPHIWAPLEYITVIGLLRYGYLEDAKRLMESYVQTNVHIFQKYGALFEKIDATTGEKPMSFWYPSVFGFGWTNGVVYKFVEILKYIDKTHGKIYSDNELENKPPYELLSLEV